MFCFEMESHHIAQANLKVVILLFQLPQPWREPPYLALNPVFLNLREGKVLLISAIKNCKEPCREKTFATLKRKLSKYNLYAMKSITYSIKTDPSPQE